MNLQEQYQKETGKKCAIPDHNGSKTIPTWEYVEWLEAKAAKPEVSEDVVLLLNEFGNNLMNAQALGMCKKHSNAVAEFIAGFLAEKQ